MTIQELTYNITSALIRRKLINCSSSLFLSSIVLSVTIRVKLTFSDYLGESSFEYILNDRHNISTRKHLGNGMLSVNL